MQRIRARLISSVRSTGAKLPDPARGFSADSFRVRSENVGFIGVGNMGFHMAKNLISAGYKLTVHDTNQEAINKFKDMGIPTKERPVDIGESSDVVITMLPTPSSVLEVYTGKNGLLQGNHPSRPWMFIDSSTVDPQTARIVSNEVSKRTLKENKDDVRCPVMLDAPVSGGVPGAESGTLTFMAAKICNNLAMAVSMVGVSEAFALGQRLGISAKTLTDIFNTSSARCWSSDSYNPVPGVLCSVPSSRDYSGGFSAKLMAKDLDFAISSADATQLCSPLASTVFQIYKELCERGHEAEDFSCVFRHHYSGKDENGSHH